MKKIFKKKLLSTLTFSAVASILLILHGIFFDFDFSQISRITIEGFLFTFILTFLALIILEKIFDLEEHEEIVKLRERVSKLEKNKS
ncbi:MAG: hypothetical protein NUV46_00950 [Nanoarchaeota archaeon]|nr:hypothetical protein [Nanoarchaeota archaeon]